MRRKKGFTIIELLVVISTVALLTSILAPALSYVKEQARSVVCMTHMRDLTLSWNVYATSNNGLMCGSYNYYGNGCGIAGEFDDKSSWVWAAWVGRQNKPVIENPYSDPRNFVTVPREEKIEGVKRGSLWPYADDIDIYRCPSDKNSNEHIRSYVIGDNLNGKAPDIRPSATWKIYKRAENVPRPSEAYVFMEESDPRPYNMDSFVFYAKSGSWSDPLAVWHKGSSSFSFGDGPVEQRHWSSETEEHFSAADGKNAYLYYEWQWSPVTDGGLDDIYWMEAGWAR